MIGRRWRWHAVGLLLSLISIMTSTLTNGVISSLAFLPVLVLFLGLPLVALVERKRAVPSWYALPLAFLLGLVVTAAVLAFDIVATSSSEHVMSVTSGIAAALNALQLVISRSSEPLKWKEPSKGSLDRKTAAAASIFVVLLIMVAYTMVQPFPSKPLTEFYLLNDDGKTTDTPYQVSVGEKVNLTVGLSNHEGRSVQYHVQVWLAEMTSASDPNSTRAMYYLDTAVVTLDHVPMPLSGEWIPQYEFDYNLTVPTDGSLRLWFFLFFDDVPSEFDGFVPMTDHYSDGGQALIEKARERQLLSLGIQLDAKAAEE